MRVGVVIPVFNHEAYVASALESVLAQSRRPDRIIAIDDGSRDRSLEICRTFESRGVEVLGQENRGAHATINRGVEMAARDCEVVAILNSDDHYRPQRFERCLPILENDAEAGVVASNLEFVDQNDQPLPEDHPRRRWIRTVWSRWDTPDLELAEWMGQANFVMSSSNIIARREFLLQHPFKAYRFNHDYYFLAQAAIRQRLRIVGETLLNYRVHTGNTINTEPAPLMRELLIQHLELYRDLAPELKADPPLRMTFYRYVRAAWDNISALHNGLLQILLAELAQTSPIEKIEQLVSALDVSKWPELQAYPNRHIASTYHHGDAFASSAAGLSDRISALCIEKEAALTERQQARELAKLRQRLLSSRRVALGVFLGVARELSQDQGKSSQEKLASLRRAVSQSRWLRLTGWKEQSQ